MGIAEIESRQLAPSVGRACDGSTVPAASSTTKFRYVEMPFGLIGPISTANKQGHKAIFYPGSGPRRVIPYVLLVSSAFDGVVTIGEIAIARRQ